MSKQFTSHRGSWGDRYIIEQNRNYHNRVSCGDCIYYQSDKSCNGKNVYVPDVGYDNWKYCTMFVMNDEGCRKNNKIRQVLRFHHMSSLRKGITVDFDKKAEREGDGHVQCWDLNDDMLKLFRNCLMKKESSILEAAFMVPVEMFEGYKIAIQSEQYELLDDAIAVFLKNICLKPARKGVRVIRRNFWKMKDELLFSGKYVQFSELYFSKLFVVFFAEYLKNKRVFDRNNS